MRANLLFLIPLLVFIFLLDWYVFSGVKILLKKRDKWLKLVKYLHWFISVCISIAFVVFFLAVKGASGQHRYTYFSVIIASFAIFYLPKVVFSIFLLLEDFTRLISFFFRRNHVNEPNSKNRYPKISRRKFVSQVGIVIVTLPFLSILFGIFRGRFNFQVRREKINFPNLPEDFNGLRIVQISDLHLGSFNKNFDKVEGAIDLINAENPDIVLFTGDLVNNFSEETIGWDRTLSRINARIGKYSVLGNHDYGDYSHWKAEAEKNKNYQEIIQAHKRFGFTLLNNETILLQGKKESIAITGVENWGLPPFPQYGDLKKASLGSEDAPFKVLMSHDPSHWDAEVLGQTSFDLTFSGHTHGMQFGIEKGSIKWSPAQYKYKRWAGLYKEGEQYLYVNRGLGYIGMPARIGMPPEITLIELVKS